MGGSAFSAGPDALLTPRMRPHVYGQVKAACHAALRALYVYVATPIEGPAKKTFGDVDVFVATERRVSSLTPRDQLGLIAIVLSAVRVRVDPDPNGTMANMAIRWPGGAADETEHRYVQLDVHIYRDADQLFWTLFRMAHGDLWTILGSVIRPFGLTMDHVGLWLRIPEIERFHKKRSKVLLSVDAAEVLAFLGMRVADYWDRPFESEDALFAYATTCRFFRVAPDQDDGTDVDGGRKPGTGQTSRLKRLRMRPLVSHWLDDFVPKLGADGFLPSPPTLARMQDTVRDQARQRFDVGREYDQRLLAWRLERQEVELWKDGVRDMIPDDVDPQQRSCLVRALKSIVAGSREWSVGPAVPLRDEHGLYDMDACRAFVADNWRRVLAPAWAKQQTANLLRMREKQEKQRQEKQKDAEAGV